MGLSFTIFVLGLSLSLIYLFTQIFSGNGWLGVQEGAQRGVVSTLLLTIGSSALAAIEVLWGKTTWGNLITTVISMAFFVALYAILFLISSIVLKIQEKCQSKKKKDRSGFTGRFVKFKKRKNGITTTDSDEQPSGPLDKYIKCKTRFKRDPEISEVRLTGYIEFAQNVIDTCRSEDEDHPCKDICMKIHDVAQRLSVLTKEVPNAFDLGDNKVFENLTEDGKKMYFMAVEAFEYFGRVSNECWGTKKPQLEVLNTTLATKNTKEEKVETAQNILHCLHDMLCSILAPLEQCAQYQYKVADDIYISLCNAQTPASGSLEGCAMGDTRDLVKCRATLLSIKEKLAGTGLQEDVRDLESLFANIQNNDWDLEFLSYSAMYLQLLHRAADEYIRSGCVHDLNEELKDGFQTLSQMWHHMSKNAHNIDVMELKAELATVANLVRMRGYVPGELTIESE